MKKFPLKYIAITKLFSSSHKGIDLGWNSKQGGKNVPVYAVDDGVVYSTKDNDKSGKSWGNFVKIKHNDGTYTLYAHLKDGIKVKKGQSVKQGTQVGNVFCNMKMCTWDQLNEMKNSGLASFGSHTFDMHYVDDKAIFLKNNQVNDFKEDIIKSKKVIPRLPILHSIFENKKFAKTVQAACSMI